MPAPPKSRRKSELQKVFILDAQGGYAGEFVVDEECVLEFGDVLAAIPEDGLADGQSIFLGEFRATALHGERLSLIAISKGDVQPEEVQWGLAALTVTEAHLSGGEPPPATGPDKGVLESLAKALEKREADLTMREKAVSDREAVIARQEADRGKATAAEMEALRKRVAESEAERARMREEMGRIANAPAGGDPTAARQQLERDRKMLQRRALELLDREEKLRGREHEQAVEAENVTQVLRENDELRSRLEALESAAGPQGFDVEGAKREMDMRVRILQQKALDLLDREEKLRKREEELRELRPQ